MKQQSDDRIPCSGCGIKISNPGENADPDALLCDTCYEDEFGLEDEENIIRIPTPDIEYYSLEEQEDDKGDTDFHRYNDEGPWDPHL